MSDDGRCAVVVIALLGNPFSPAYFRRRTSSPARALDHCALNVAVYEASAGRWSLVERRLEDHDRATDAIRFGASRYAWERDAVVIDVDEPATPLGRPIRGRVVLHRESASGPPLALDEAANHRWWPVAPFARIEVALREPSLHFTGHGYHDVNRGGRGLEQDFARWTWARARLADRVAVAYDVSARAGSPRSLTLMFDRDGAAAPRPGRSRAPLPRSRWGLARTAPVGPEDAPRIVRRLEDGPFYARDVLAARLDGADARWMHETLSLDRWQRRWVRFLAQFRMADGD